ncbi:cAMP-dependent protein kinase catalytic subunit, variant 3 [Balamuthia mandrillaris]
METTYPVELEASQLTFALDVISHFTNHIVTTLHSPLSARYQQQPLPLSTSSTMLSTSTNDTKGSTSSRSSIASSPPYSSNALSQAEDASDEESEEDEGLEEEEEEECEEGLEEEEQKYESQPQPQPEAEMKIENREVHEKTSARTSPAQPLSALNSYIPRLPISVSSSSQLRPSLNQQQHSRVLPYVNQHRHPLPSSTPTSPHSRFVVEHHQPQQQQYYQQQQYHYHQHQHNNNGSYCPLCRENTSITNSPLIHHHHYHMNATDIPLPRAPTYEPQRPPHLYHHYQPPQSNGPQLRTQNIRLPPSSSSPPSSTTSLRGIGGEGTIARFLAYNHPNPSTPREVLKKLLPPNTLSLEQFEILRTLGTGSFGTVRLCRQKHTGRYYCLKILNKEKVIQLKQVQHVKNEKSVLEKVSHPFIMKLYATFQDSCNLYFLLEYLSGGELFTLVRRNKKRAGLSNEAACFYAAEIVLALRFLHSLDIAHRDLKPENILLDAFGHIKLTDFGFAKEITDRTWTMCGTPDYIAPEVLLGRGYGTHVDWWSFGVLVYEMLAGKPPFHCRNKFQIFEKILSCDYTMPEWFPKDAADLVRNLLQIDVTRRLGCMKGSGGIEEVMNHPWFQCIDWDALYRRRVVPPWQHGASSDDGDTRNFCQYADVDKMAILEENKQSRETDQLFVNF